MSSDPSPANYRLEILRTEVNNPEKVEEILNFYTDSSVYLLHKCNSGEGAFLRSKNNAEELIFYNAMIEPDDIFKVKAPATANKLLTVATAHPNFTVAIRSVSGDRVKIFVADNETFWQERSSSTAAFGWPY